MSIVFFTYAFPPLRSPRSIQIARLVKYSRHSIRIFCCDNPAAATDRSLLAVSDVKSLDLKAFPLRRYAAADPRRWVSSLPIPDPFRSWASETAGWIIERRLVTTEDVLVTFGHPMSDHLGGLRIKRALNIPWMAHFSDPWVDNPFRHAASRFVCRRMERAVLSRADSVIFTSEQTAELVMRKYPQEWRRKVTVIPHAYDPELYPSICPAGPGLTIRSLGSFYKQRTPQILFQALSILQRDRPHVLADVHIEIIGHMKGGADLRPLHQKLPPGLLDVRPHVDYLMSLKLMCESDLLLLIDAPLERSVFLPSKLIDYLGANRPIFGITPPGAAADVIREAGEAIASPSDPHAVATELERLIKQLHTSRQRTLKSPELREKYSAPRVAAMMDEAIRELHLR